MPVAITTKRFEQATKPFALVADHPLRRIGRKGLLLQLSQHIENQGMQSGTPPVVVSSFQTASQFTPATERRYQSPAEHCPLVCAIGLDLCADRHQALTTIGGSSSSSPTTATSSPQRPARSWLGSAHSAAEHRCSPHTQGVSASILGMRHQMTLNSFAVSTPHSETNAETRCSPRPPCSR